MNHSVFTSFTPNELESLILDCVSRALENHQPVTTKIEIEYLTRKETAQKLNISLPTLWKLTKNGNINAYKIGKRVLYRLDDIDNVTHQMDFNPKYKP